MGDVDIKIEFQNFLAGDYASKVDEMMAKSQSRLVVDLASLSAYTKELYERVLDQPQEAIPQCERALAEEVANKDPKAAATLGHLRVGFTGAFGWRRCCPRELLSDKLSRLVCVEGIVTKCSLVRPKLTMSKHYNPKTDKFEERKYEDVTSLAQNRPTGVTMATKDAEGNPLTVEMGACDYRDHQTIVVQEPPETAPPGQLPRSVKIVLEEDLVDLAKPGDRVSVSGVFRVPPRRGLGPDTGVSRALVVANALVRRESDVKEPTAFTQLELRNIKALAGNRAREPVLNVLSRSLAPSIFGLDAVKRALVMQLVGGTEKVLTNGTRLRGDINVLLVGDPGVAKSQLLRAVQQTAPLAVTATGRGSSGVGLTAAVTTDQETGDRRLEAGAMVLADRGVVCIDEFDKMNDTDRVAIHEVMEQQTVTIAKAGIHATLNARCAVTAAANPLYGTYEPSLSITQNINLPDSLLSRFDVLFVLLDTKDPVLDAQLATHVLKVHAYLPDAVQHLVDDVTTSTNSQSGEAMWLKYDASTMTLEGGARARCLTPSFLRKYIQYVKRTYDPQLTEEASRQIAELWAEMRQRAVQARGAHGEEGGDAEAAASGHSALPITARTLETLIRLSTAHAKIRQSNLVELVDVDGAAQVLQEAMYHGAAPLVRGPATPRRGAEQDDEDDDMAGQGQGQGQGDADHAEGEEEQTGPGQMSGPSKRARKDGDRRATGNASDVSSIPTHVEPQEVEDEEFGLPPGPEATARDRYVWRHRQGRDLSASEKNVVMEVLGMVGRQYHEDESGSAVEVDAVAKEVLRRCANRPGAMPTAGSVARAILALTEPEHTWEMDFDHDLMYPNV